MSERQLGPYRLIADLGSGGMGKVHLAETVEAAAGLEPGTKVAIKVVHPHLLDTPGFFKRFMREADLGKRVRHPNVVRTFDVDALTQEGRHHHYMVMEYVEGKSLRELLIELGTIPETLLREIAVQIATGLAAIHDAGIVHRDLKPENILITDEHEIRIMDLGVAKLQEASIALTKEGQFAGSLLYAAPEQFKSETVGPPADQYSLGVMLYELATGQNPFRGDAAAAVIKAHLDEQPPRAGERNEDLSPFFSEVIATLLAKRAADRFRSSEQLRSVLAEAERSAWWVERAPALQRREARLPRIRVRRETKLYGRDEDLARLRLLFQHAAAGQGNTVLIEGEAGIGKTRLLDEFLRGLGGQDFHVLYGSYPPSGGMGGLSEAILGKFGEAGLADALAPYLTVTPSLVPTFVAQMKHERLPTGVDPLQGDALQAVVVHLMRALAAEKPTVWIVDDVHFAPQESHDFLLAMARAVEDHRVLLVATARSGLDLSDFSRLGNFRRLPIGRLSPRDVVHLLQGAFRSEALAEKLGGKIAVKSDGVPFFVFEMIRGLEEGQFIRQRPDGSYVQTQVVDEIEVPSAVKDLIEGRMRGLTEGQRTILDAGAVQGMTFDPGLVASVLEEKRVRVLQQLAEIERRHGLVLGEAGRTRFDQNQIQEVLYLSLPPDLRAEYHTLLADAYAEQCDAEPEGDDACFLAYHHVRGSRPRRALPLLEPALDHLAQSYRNDRLLDLATRALKARGLLEGGERVEVLLRQAGCLDTLGRRDEERDALDEALALADRTGDRALRSKARQSRGRFLHVRGQHDAARAPALEALDLARAAGDRQLEVRATALLGAVFWGLGRYAEAQELFERSRELACGIGDRRGELLAIGNLGVVLHALGRGTEALEHHERCRALAREIGDRRSEARTLGNLAVVLMGQGRSAEAQERLERGRDLAREIGDRLGESNAVGNLGGVSSMLGRLAEARDHDVRHQLLAREIGDGQGEARATRNLGTVSLALGRCGEAREQAERALALAREIGNRAHEAHALQALGEIAENEGEDEESSRRFEEALALRRELGERRQIPELLVPLARLEAATGAADSAATRLDEALALARETENPESILAATVERARLPDGDVGAASAALEEHEGRVSHAARMRARFRLWELTGDRRQLAEAHRLLRHLRDHAPEDCRDSMIERVLLYRDIMQAWRENGAEGEPG